MANRLLFPTLAWVALVALTLLIWGLYVVANTYVFVAAVMLSMAKVAIIGFYFMDIKFAKREVIACYFAWVFFTGALFILSVVLR